MIKFLLSVLLLSQTLYFQYRRFDLVKAIHARGSTDIDLYETMDVVGKRWLVVAWRGTQFTSVNDLMTDLNGLETDFILDNVNRGTVHMGFYNCYMSVREEIVKNVAYSSYNYVYITGHNLGGALTYLHTMDLRFRGITVTRTVTIGAPPVGLGQFIQDNYNAINVPGSRYVNRLDQLETGRWVPDLIPTVSQSFFNHLVAEDYLVCGEGCPISMNKFGLLPPWEFKALHSSDLYMNQLRRQVPTTGLSCMLGNYSTQSQSVSLYSWKDTDLPDTTTVTSTIVELSSTDTIAACFVPANANYAYTSGKASSASQVVFAKSNTYTSFTQRTINVTQDGKNKLILENHNSVTNAKISYNVKIVPPIPSTPSNIRLVSDGPNSITFTWDAPSQLGVPSTVSKWIVSYSTPQGGYKTIDIGPSYTSFEYSDLEVHQWYSFRVAAHNGKYQSPFSSSLSAYTYFRAPIIRSFTFSPSTIVANTNTTISLGAGSVDNWVYFSPSSSCVNASVGRVKISSDFKVKVNLPAGSYWLCYGLAEALYDPEFTLQTDSPTRMTTTPSTSSTTSASSSTLSSTSDVLSSTTSTSLVSSSTSLASSSSSSSSSTSDMLISTSSTSTISSTSSNALSTSSSISSTSSSTSASSTPPTSSSTSSTSSSASASSSTSDMHRINDKQRLPNIMQHFIYIDIKQFLINLIDFKQLFRQIHQHIICRCCFERSSIRSTTSTSSFVSSSTRTSDDSHTVTVFSIGGIIGTVQTFDQTACRSQLAYIAGVLYQQVIITAVTPSTKRADTVNVNFYIQSNGGGITSAARKIEMAVEEASASPTDNPFTRAAAALNHRPMTPSSFTNKRSPSAVNRRWGPPRPSSLPPVVSTQTPQDQVISSGESWLVGWMALVSLLYLALYVLQEVWEGRFINRETFPDLPNQDLYLCFSGGGIRSAAFCHGVFEFMLKRRYHIQQMYCVSGGGYLGSSFVQNVHVDVEKGMTYEEAIQNWLREKRMENHPNFCCDCDHPLKGTRDLILFILVVFLSFLWTVLWHAPIFFFFGSLVNAIFGQLFRTQVYRGWYPAAALLILTSLLWGFWNFTRAKKTNAWRRAGNTSAAAGTFTLVFGLLFIFLIIELPFYSYSQAGYALTWASLILLILAGKIFDWLIPDRSFGILSALVYAFLCSLPTWWRIQYPESRAYDIVLGISACVWLIPFSLLNQTWWSIPGNICQTDTVDRLHTFYRWRLQRAFYKDSGWCGLAGVFLQSLTCGGQATTLGDLKYKGVVSANGWKMNANTVHPSQSMTLNAGGHAVMQSCGKHIEMNTYRLSSVMATSGAAVAIQMGEYDNAAMRFWQSQFGLGMGNWVSPDGEPAYVRPLVLLAYHVQFPIVVGLVAFRQCSAWYLIIPFSLLVLIILIAMAFSPKWRLVRWLYWIPIVFSFYQFLNLYIIGTDHKGRPPRLYLADGNFADNLGLFPALKERRRHIIVVDGSCDPAEDSKDLLQSLNISRSYTNVSFIPVSCDGRSETDKDIETAIKIFAKERTNPLMLIRVIFEPKKGETNPEEGMIFYVKPRRMFAEMMMDENKFKDLHGACLPSCHTSSFSFTSALCNEFPHHATLNQWFTKEMFRCYDELGRRSAEYIFQQYHDDLKTSCSSVVSEKPSVVSMPNGVVPSCMLTLPSLLYLYHHFIVPLSARDDVADLSRGATGRRDKAYRIGTRQAAATWRHLWCHVITGRPASSLSEEGLRREET
ncbi:hypothetical protein PROFUN_12961 [Planoprotostelium fungivorum]|uniref:Fibronectin type-III domain-containing protein n=1 Tax=Planoprotostelium fungivorum TaxID=1890364 RepID=A0A2P6MZJ8_9EUKA|nr:hypothetical protein PROFUN_12961 [Planoprotostelium fungivorum]